MMYQPVENTASCLNCTNQWPTVWASKELISECPRCRWKLGVPIEFISSGWWTTQERARDSRG